MRLALFAAAAMSAIGAHALTLDDLIDAALANSPALNEASFDQAAARAQAGQAQSAWMPQIKGHTQYARTDNPPQAFFMNLNQRVASLQNDFNNPPDTEDLGFGFNAGWLLFDGGRRQLDIDMAQLGTRARGISRDIVVNQLVHAISTTFYGALEARDAIGVANAAVHSIEESRRLADVRVQSGAAMKSDVLNLDVKLAEARQHVISASNGYALAIAAINSFVGADVATAAQLDTVCMSQGDTSAQPNPDDVSVARRPEMKAARVIATIKQKAYDKSRRAYFPQLSVFGEVDWNSDVSTDFKDSYLAGVAADIDIFDGSRRAKAVAQAKAEWDSAQAAADLAQRQLELDLTQARLAIADARARAEVAQSGAVSAAEALRLAHQRYENGAADISELLNAETANAASQTTASAAAYEILIAQSDLDRALGLYAAHYSEGGKP